MSLVSNMGTVWICKEFISVTICCYSLTVTVSQLQFHGYSFPVTVSLGGCLSVHDKRDERERKRRERDSERGERETGV